MPRLAILACSVLALVTAGCGGDGDAEPATGGAAAEGGTLEGRVGPGFDISLGGTDGIEAGTYTLTVDDMSPAHNFHLTGPGGVDVSTSVGERGEESFEVTLEPGEYTFLCDPHATSMRGTFTVR